MINVFDISQSDTHLKKVSSSGGGEYAGPCPFCGGHDRFRVQPNKRDGGRWYCRHCGENKWHDAIDYLMRRNNWKFPEAQRYVEGDTSAPLKPLAYRPPAAQVAQHQADCDSDIWQARAHEFAKFCEENLVGVAGDETAKWLRSRGISEHVAEQAHLGYNPKDMRDAPERWGYPKTHEKIYLSHGLTIPNIDTAGIHAIKIRRPDPGIDKKYLTIKGSEIWIYGAWTCQDALSAFLFESELDVLLAFSSGYGFGYLAIPANQKIQPRYQYIMSDIQDVVVMPDNDKPGLAHADELSKIPHFYTGLTPPAGKDISEFYQLTGRDGAQLLDMLYESASVIDGKL